MAKKAKTLQNFRTKQLKDGTFQIYHGRKVATPEERKDYFRLNGGYGMIPEDKLSENEVKFIKKMKAGKARAASALTDKFGKFLSKNTEKQIEKMMGGSMEAVLKAKGVKTLKEAVKADSNFRDKLFTIIDRTESEFHFNSNHYQQQIKDFPGVIKINGKQVTKEQAIARIAKLQQAGARNYQKGFDFSVKMKLKGLRELNMSLPTTKQVEQMDTEEFEDKFGDNFRIYGS